MSEIATTVDAYLAMWNEPDPERRAERIAGAWSEDGSYLDPLMAAEGHAQLSAMVAQVQAQFPGHRFRRASAIDAYGDRLRFAWELTGPDGSPAAAGIDVGVLAPDGRLRSITGFFGDLAGEGES